MKRHTLSEQASVVIERDKERDPEGSLRRAGDLLVAAVQKFLTYDKLNEPPAALRALEIYVGVYEDRLRFALSKSVELDADMAEARGLGEAAREILNQRMKKKSQPMAATSEPAA